MTARAKRGLLGLNFFVADMQSGIGPFLGVFLLAHGWTAGPIGTVLTVGGVAGMLITAPAGAFIDHTRHKRALIVVAGISTVLASCLILMSQSGFVVTFSQMASAITGAAIGPAITGITLGVVRQRGFIEQNGRNQVVNHAGNFVGAALSGYLGWKFGMAAIFWLAAAFGVLATISTLSIPAVAIDHRAARGLEAEGKAGESDELVEEQGHAEGFRQLLRNRPMLLLALCLACFHLGNGAMLPLYGMAVVSSHQGDAAMFTAETVMIAQGVMVFAALIATRVARRTSGYWLVLLISFIVLPIRGLVAGNLIAHWGVWPVQILDGVGAGLQSVAVPGLVARLLDGTGRVNVGQGSVISVQNIGASLSPALGGWLVEMLGYRYAFFILGGFALLSIALWVTFSRLLLKAHSRQQPTRRRAHAP